MIISPSAVGLVGSPTRQAASILAAFGQRRSIFFVPLTDNPSSSPVISRLIEPGMPPGRCSRKRADRRHEAGDRRLHVRSAAAVEAAVADLGRERIDAPGAEVAGRHHVGVAGEAEVRACRAETSVEIIDRRRPLLGERHSLADEAERPQRRLQHVERARVDRRDARAADQRSAELDGINDRRHGCAKMERGEAGRALGPTGKPSPGQR